ncbi:hypothetical protein EBX31_01540 [bacterium]|nr:hypothetical protein [bacterium]
MSLITVARRMAPSLSRGIPLVYVLRLQSGGLSTGCSTDFVQRFHEHENGSALPHHKTCAAGIGRLDRNLKGFSRWPPP